MKSLLAILILFSSIAGARVINRPEDELRLGGWDSYLKNNESFVKDRDAGLGAWKTQQAAWEKHRSELLQKYKLQKQKNADLVDESGAGYQQYLNEKKEYFEKKENSRKTYIQKREDSRRRFQKQVALSEEHEYGIDEELPRVDWKKRQVYGFVPGGSGAPSSGGGSMGGGGYPNTSPPFMNIGDGEDGFDESVPPPPPMENGTFEESSPIPPPPPPPIMDEDATPF